MDNDNKKALLKNYLISFGVAVVLVFFVLAMKSFDMSLAVLCDAFFVSGLALVLFCGLMYVSGEGVFIPMKFLFSKVVKSFIPGARTGKEETYAEFRESQTGKKHMSVNSCMFFTGLFFLLISIVFLILWYQV